MDSNFKNFHENYWKENEAEIGERIRKYLEEYKEELKKEIILEYKLNVAEKLLKNTSLSTEVIAENVVLPVEKVEGLKRKISNS